jgi:hypothetical protein
MRGQIWMGRRSFLRTLAGGLLTAPLAAEAQQTGNLPRVGYLSNSARYDEPDTGFFAGLREHGYEPDRNILVEARYSAGRPTGIANLPRISFGSGVGSSWHGVHRSWRKSRG